MIDRRHGTWSNIQAIRVEALCAKIGGDWHVVRDKTAMRPGDLISTFMKTISRADLDLILDQSDLHEIADHLKV